MPAAWDQRRTFYGWRSKYDGLEVSEAKRPKQLEEENAKLLRILTDRATEYCGQREHHEYQL